MKILVLNAGSSSLKYALYENLGKRVEGNIEHIGEPNGPKDHRTALFEIERELAGHGEIRAFDELDAVGHRVVHGGEKFVEPVQIDERVVEAIRALIPLAPLHNPANLQGIELMRKLIPDIPQVAVFDTAFHQSMEEEAYLYAIPLALYEKYGIRRYGFHGTSHAYVAKEAAKYLKRAPETLNLITLHLGNGASACAVQRGRSVDTSMGFTPLEGLVMGTRSGDIDPEIPIFMQKEGMDADRLLNKESGLKGLCGHNDVRTIEKMAKAGDKTSRTALKIFSRRIKKYIGAYTALLGNVDAVVFTGGIGEHSAMVRRMVCEGLEPLGICLDDTKNRKNVNIVSTEGSGVKILVIPTDEALEIARQTETVLSVHKL
ncbi:acetate/propionate family kinase [Hydrogenimonas cancrithermarum]|uniref:Acetate kinase n=1 Tax=Hydrogenimonas cancrithermarum TaxID=2993563 RepID=A0ABN6WX55_9BACT|nr:acetate kinase [Hydrogenimonas cancrithermarum]BDY13865.1 acetate kinase [Hydrogenimonas cancrithermarum]